MDIDLGIDEFDLLNKLPTKISHATKTESPKPVFDDPFF